MTVTLTLDDLKTILGIISAVAAVVALVWKGFKWIHHQKEQDVAIAKLEKKLEDQDTAHKKEIAELKTSFKSDLGSLRELHNKDIASINTNHEASVQAIQEEQALMTYGLLACLKGLAEQGCDGPVSEAIDKMEKHINMRAHGQI